MARPCKASPTDEIQLEYIFQRAFLHPSAFQSHAIVTLPSGSPFTPDQVAGVTTTVDPYAVLDESPLVPLAANPGVAFLGRLTVYGSAAYRFRAARAQRSRRHRAPPCERARGSPIMGAPRLTTQERE